MIIKPDTASNLELDVLESQIPDQARVATHTLVDTGSTPEAQLRSMITFQVLVVIHQGFT